VADRHRPEAPGAIAGDPAARLRDELELLGVTPEEFRRAAGLAYRRSVDILEMTIEPHMPNYMTLLKMQQDAARNIMGMFGRINPGELKGGVQDKVGALLEKIKAE
jgi:hypothetical protein